MSWQAQTAVTHHSKQTKIERLRLLMYLADVANASGAVDPAPNQKTLAAFLDTTDRTIRTYLSAIEADGEIKQTRVGSGPGNPSAYQITLPMPENGREGLDHEPEKGGGNGGKVEENPDFVSTFEAFKAEIKAEIFELKAEINQLKAERAIAEGGKVEGERRKGHSFKNADDPDFDPDFDPNTIQEEEGESPLPPAPSEPFPFRPSPKTDLPEHEGPADKRLKALLKVCGLSADIPAHVNKAANAAVQLRDFSAGWILDRYSQDPPAGGGWHWYSDDWRGQRGDMPDPDQVVATVAKQKTVVRASANSGKSNSRAEEVAVQYAKRRQEFFNNGQDTDTY